MCDTQHFRTILVFPSVINNALKLLGVNYSIKKKIHEHCKDWNKFEMEIKRLVKRHGARWRMAVKDNGTYNRFIKTTTENVNRFKNGNLTIDGVKIKVLKKEYNPDFEYDNDKIGCLYISDDETKLPFGYDVINDYDQIINMSKEIITLTYFNSNSAHVPIRYYTSKEFEWLEECQTSFSIYPNVHHKIMLFLSKCEIKLMDMVCVVNFPGCKLIRSKRDVKKDDKLLVIPDDELTKDQSKIQLECYRMVQKKYIHDILGLSCNVMVEIKGLIISFTISFEQYKSFGFSRMKIGDYLDCNIIQDLVYESLSTSSGNDIKLRRLLSVAMFSDLEVKYLRTVPGVYVNINSEMYLSNINLSTPKLYIIGNKGSGKSSIADKINKIGYSKYTIEVDDWNKMLSLCNENFDSYEKCQKAMELYLKMTIGERKTVKDYFMSYCENKINEYGVTYQDIMKHTVKYDRIVFEIMELFRRCFDCALNVNVFIDKFIELLFSGKVVDSKGMCYDDSGRVLVLAHCFSEIQQSCSGNYVELDCDHIDLDVVNYIRHKDEDTYNLSRIVLSRVYEYYNSSFIRRVSHGNLLLRCRAIMS